MSRGGDLLRLQEIDGRLAHERARLRDLEALIETDPELDVLRRDARRRRREREAADAALSAAETESETLRRRVRELDRHLYDGSVRNPQELLAMQHDLGVVRARLDEQDERQLTLMETAELAGNAVRDATAAVVEREGARADHAGDLLDEALAVRAVVESHEEERATLVAAIPAGDVTLYERLSRRLGPAVVRIVHDSCGGCHMPFTSSEVRRIRLAEVPVQCSECDRVVVP